MGATSILRSDDDSSEGNDSGIGEGAECVRVLEGWTLTWLHRAVVVVVVLMVISRCWGTRKDTTPVFCPGGSDIFVVGVGRGGAESGSSLSSKEIRECGNISGASSLGDGGEGFGGGGESFGGSDERIAGWSVPGGGGAGGDGLCGVTEYRHINTLDISHSCSWTLLWECE